MICNQCGVEIENWDSLDDPMTEHARQFPQCKNLRKNQDTSPKIVEMHKQSQTTLLQQNLAEGLNSTNLKMVNSNQMNANKLQVRCVQCGFEMKWESSGNPWTEHARQFPQCKNLQKNPDTENLKLFELAQTALFQQNWAEGLSSATNLKIDNSNQMHANRSYIIKDVCTKEGVEPMPTDEDTEGGGQRQYGRPQKTTVTYAKTGKKNKNRLGQILATVPEDGTTCVQEKDKVKTEESLEQKVEIAAKKRNKKKKNCLGQVLVTAPQEITRCVEMKTKEANSEESLEQKFEIADEMAALQVELLETAKKRNKKKKKKNRPGQVSAIAPEGILRCIEKKDKEANTEESLEQKDENEDELAALGIEYRNKAKKRNKKKKNCLGQDLATALQDSTRCVKMKTKKANSEESLEQKFDIADEMAALQFELRETDPQVPPEENKRLLCIVCMDADINIVFLPCGHLVCCSTCARVCYSCPICRTKILGTVRTYLS